MRDLIESAGRIGAFALIALAFGLGFGESAVGLDFIVPGEVGMVFMGAAAREGDVTLVAVILVGAFGAIAGDCTGFFLGRRYGGVVVHRWSWVAKRLEPSIARADEYFAKRGGWAVFGARWVGALRALVPVVAGTAAMPFRRFIVWEVPASLLWTATVVCVGYYAGDDIAEVVDRIGLWTSLAIVGLLVVGVTLRRRLRPR
ncbi:MAG: DedA family protein [Actinomycetota bacterium]